MLINRSPLFVSGWVFLSLGGETGWAKKKQTAAGNASQCQRVFTGHGPTKQAAKDTSEALCQAAGCHTPGSQPYNCQCGHTWCHRRAELRSRGKRGKSKAFQFFGPDFNQPVRALLMKNKNKKKGGGGGVLHHSPH